MKIEVAMVVLIVQIQDDLLLLLLGRPQLIESLH